MKRIVIYTTLIFLAFLLFTNSVAANQWYIEDGPHSARYHIPVGETVVVPTTGTYTLKLRLDNSKQWLKSKCSINGTNALSNPTLESTVDEVRALELSCSEGVSITPVLPWTGSLLGNGQPFIDPMTLTLEASIDGTSYGTFSGPIEAEYGDFDPPKGDEIDNTFKLNKGGMLVGAKGEVRLTVQDKYGVKGLDRADGELEGTEEQTEAGHGNDSEKDEEETTANTVMSHELIQNYPELP
jgi:hypothetical protein